jgi:hypothetical protein
VPEPENTSWTMPIREGSSDIVTINAHGVAYRDWYVESGAVTGIAFGAQSLQSVLSSSTNWCKVSTQYKTYKISSSSKGVSGFFHRRDNVGFISKAIARWAAESLLIDILHPIVTENKEMSIGELVFSKKGVRRKGIFSTDIIPWSRNPTIRTSGETSFLDTFRRTGFMYLEFGAIEVCVAHPVSGKTQSVGFASSAEMNGYLVPAIIANLSGRY